MRRRRMRRRGGEGSRSDFVYFPVITETNGFMIQRREGKMNEEIQPVLFNDCTVIQKRLKSRCKYWATRSSARSFARTAHSGAHGKEVFVYELNASISYHFEPLCG